jgi:transcriptional regulator with XRE-family HTH domain
VKVPSPSPRERLNDEFGRKLFMARRRAGMSQEALAKSSGLHFATISLFETANRTPRLDTICRLADGLGIRPGELIEGIADGGYDRA